MLRCEDRYQEAMTVTGTLDDGAEDHLPRRCWGTTSECRSDTFVVLLLDREITQVKLLHPQAAQVGGDAAWAVYTRHPGARQEGLKPCGPDLEREQRMPREAHGFRPARFSHRAYPRDLPAGHCLLSKPPISDTLRAPPRQTSSDWPEAHRGSPRDGSQTESVSLRLAVEREGRERGHPPRFLAPHQGTLGAVLQQN